MIVPADSRDEAIQKIVRKYGYNEKDIQITTIRPPGRKLMGMVKKSGMYKINIEKNHGDIETTNSKDGNGSIEVKNGNFLVRNPKGSGRYPSIVTGDSSIELFVNGKKVDGAVVVTEEDNIEVKLSEEEPRSEIRVRVSEDKMQASLTISKIPGKRYYLSEAAPDVSIVLQSGYHDIKAYNLTSGQCIEELEKAGVRKNFIDVDRVCKLVNKPEGGTAVVAMGVEPVDGIDSEIKYYFQEKSFRNPELDKGGKVDLKDFMVIPTVKTGDVLAEKTMPAVEGRDGVTVTGQPIKARKAIDFKLKDGEGAKLMEVDNKIVATCSGRPELRDGTVCVRQVMVVQGNVDAKTGNIHFEGDVHVNGNILDGMKVRTEGLVMVKGNVMHSEIETNGDVMVSGNVIGSTIMAGMSIFNNLYILPEMEKIFAFLVEIRDKTKEHDNEWINEGTSKMLIKHRDQVKSFSKQIDKIGSLMAEVEKEQITRILTDVNIMLMRIINMGVPAIDHIEKACNNISKYIGAIKKPHSMMCNATVSYCQNSLIQANGNILVTGKGSYQANLIAQNAILFKNKSSVARGGVLMAGKHIKMGVVGSPAGVSTYCRVFSSDGKIEAGRYYSNTVLNANGKARVIKENI